MKYVRAPRQRHRSFLQCYALIAEGKRQSMRKAAAAIEKDQNPETPGAHMYPKVNLALVWSRVDRTSHPDGCWIWRGPLQANGTEGCLWTGERNGVPRRVIYELCTDDQLTSKLRLYPICKTPLCVNPSHVTVGSRMPTEKKVEELRATPMGATVPVSIQ
jgi:hypothetical protein